MIVQIFMCFRYNYQSLLVVDKYYERKMLNGRYNTDVHRFNLSLARLLLQFECLKSSYARCWPLHLPVYCFITTSSLVD